MNNIYLIFLLTLNVLFTGVNISYAHGDTNTVRELLISTTDKTKSLPEIVDITDEAIALAENLNYLQGKADALDIKGRTYLKIGDYSSALKAFWEELSLREKNPDWDNSSTVHTFNMIGESYRAIGSFDLALRYLDKSIKINEQLKDNKELAYSYNRIAAIYHELSIRKSDTSESIQSEEIAFKSIEYDKNNTDLIVSSYNIIGASRIFREDYDGGLEILFSALRLCENDSTYLDRPNILNNISSAYSLKGDYTNSLKYALQSYELSKKSGIQVYILVAARAISDAYSKLGDYKNAFLYLSEAHHVYLHLYDDRKTAEIYSLQKNHELELKEQNENAKTTKIKIIGVAVFVLIFTIFIGLFIRHRQQLKLNRELTYKNEIISKQKEELTSSNGAKDKFFSILSHDIRNPLNGILGFSNILESEFNEIDDKEKKEYIGYLKTSSESLFVLIDKLLMWSRLQTGRVDLKMENLNLKEIILYIMGLQKANAIKKGIVLESDISEDINVNADKYLLDTVLRNLVDNAVKFTEPGGKVTIQVDSEGDFININVIDEGVGINDKDIEKLFLIDQKIVSEGTAKEQGTGLGLILCKDMLDLMGTKLNVESEKGKGSRFFFRLYKS